MAYSGLGRVRDLLIASLLLASTIPYLSAQVVASGLRPHPSITIEGNQGFTPNNGLIGGSGTVSDPYVIEGWQISSQAYCISVRNTNASFIIRSLFVYSCGFGIFLEGVANGRVESVRASKNAAGIVISSSSNVTLFGSDVSNNVNSEDDEGVGVFRSSNVTISGNDVSANARRGIYIYGSSNIAVSQNRVFSNEGEGILIGFSSGIRLSNNDLSLNRGRGIVLFCSTYATFSANVLTLDGVYLHCSGDTKFFDSHTFTQDNLVNGKPLRFYRDCRGVDVESVPVGELIVVNCRGVRVASVSITHTDIGIQMAFVNDVIITHSSILNNDVGILFLNPSSNVTISKNVLSGNRIGAFLLSASKVTVSSNRVFSNSQSGIDMDSSSGVTIANNDVASNGYGVFVSNSQNAWISANTVSSNRLAGIASLGLENLNISDNSVSSNRWSGIDIAFSSSVSIKGNTVSYNRLWGVSLHGSSGVHVYHNSLLNNNIQARDDRGSENSWDFGYPGGGNFWSDYVGVDNCSGPDQNICSKPDGIGDTPYVIDSDSRDRYPLTEPP